MSRRIAFTVLLLTCVPAGRCAADTQFLLLSGRDTIATERFVITPSRMSGTMIMKGAGMRVDYVLTLTAPPAPRAPVALAMSVRGLSLPDSAPPAQRVVFKFGGDSVRVTQASGAAQSFECPAGAWPYVNPSLAMLAMALRDTRPTARETLMVPLVMTAGGRKAKVFVRALTGDSVHVDLAGLEMRLARDAQGMVVGGTVPAQGIRLEASIVTSGEGYHPRVPTDYSAPAGAPYTAESVRVPVPGGFSLAGTLTRPTVMTRAVPCVLTLTGSGLEDRDETLPIVPGYRPFRQVADALGRRGIATLRLDDRGFGESGGDPSAATSADFANDARAALAWLGTREGIDGRRLALLGHSEGGLIAPLVAADDHALRAIVLLAAPSRTGRRVIEYQNRQSLVAGTKLDPGARDARVREAMAAVDSMAAGNPWLKFFLDYDPLPVARRVTLPVLVLQGGTDRQVEAAQAAELGAAFRAGGNRDVTVHVLQGVNHLFLDDPNGDPARYARLPHREIDAAILGEITEWLVKRLK